MSNSDRPRQFVVTVKTTLFVDRRVYAYSEEDARQKIYGGESGEVEEYPNRVRNEIVNVVPVRSDE